MKRKILFRGKTYNKDKKDWIEWIEGLPLYLTEYGKDFEEIDGIQCSKTRENYDINPETISQFTGVLDKNKIKVFEGDRVRVFIKGAWFETVVVWGVKSNGWSLKCDRTNEKFGVIKYYSLPHSKYIEVIGNIYDNGSL